MERLKTAALALTVVSLLGDVSLPVGIGLIVSNNSLDARGLGVLLSPEDAYRFARGEEVIASHGLPVKLSRPLDWLVVADHSDGMGAMKEIIAGNPRLLQDPTGRCTHHFRYQRRS